MTTTTVERRRHTRVHLKQPTEVLTEDGRRFRTLTRDLSLRGFFLETTERVALGTRLRIRLWQDRDAAPMVLSALVVDRRPLGLGCEITAIHQPEALEQLRRFLIERADESGLLLAELQQELGENQQKPTD